jgi:serine/threonine protein kinase
MTVDRWKEIERLYQASLNLGSEQRARFLAESCNDEEMRREVESLLAQRGKVPSFLEQRGLDVAANMIPQNQPKTLVGRTIDHYEVLAFIGAGGMGDVYRARDSRLGRDVALKILPAQFSEDPERMRRSEREAKLLASLNHPNIAAIYDLEESDGIRCLILEFVQGETLAERLKRGPVPMAEVLEISRQMADALEAAHEQGVVHRDLKPANVMISAAGRVKVLDFGIAKLLEPQAGANAATNIDSASAGVVLGTPSYMSPEQARGKPIDKRTDIWAFGCVLYELLTGRRAFQGETVTDTLAAVVDRDPDWQALPKNIPEKIRDLLRHCLQKDVRQRLRDIGDARIQIEEAAKEPVTARSFPAVRPRRRRALMVAAAALFTLLLLSALAISAFLYFRPSDGTQARFLIEPPPMPNEFLVSVSPDGRKVAFVARAADKMMLFVRPIDSVSAQPLAGTEGARHPFWSPDSRYIGFGAYPDSKLKKIDAAGGPPQTLCDFPSLFNGGTWNSKDVILFSQEKGNQSLIYRVSAEGGMPAQISTLDNTRQEQSHVWPYFLPDGRHYLYLAWSKEARNRAVYIGSLDSDEKKLLMPAESMAVYAPPGFLLFQREGTLLAQAFDPERLELSGELVRLADDVLYNPGNGRAAFAVSSNGALVYRARPQSRQLVWIDRNGKTSPPIGSPLDARSLRLSPDGKRVAFSNESDEGNTWAGDIWIYDIDQDLRTKLTTHPALDHWPIWSPDGSRLAFDSERDGPSHTLYEKPSNGASPERLLLQPEPGFGYGLLDWSLDGRIVVFQRVKQGSPSGDLWVLPLFGDRKPFSYLTAPFPKGNAALSPNGRWLAYVSGEAGIPPEVVVQPFPDPSKGKWQISRNGGAYPRWRRDGRELYYLDRNLRIVAVSVSTDNHFEVGESVSLFEAPILFPPRHGPSQGPDYPYDVTPDGQRFLVASLFGTTPITVVVNWPASLKR